MLKHNYKVKSITCELVEFYLALSNKAEIFDHICKARDFLLGHNIKCPAKFQDLCKERLDDCVQWLTSITNIPMLRQIDLETDLVPSSWNKTILASSDDTTIIDEYEARILYLLTA